MKESKRARLTRAGFRVGSAGDFLELSKAERALVALKLDLVDGVKTLREERQITQSELARRLGSSQSRVAKLEAGEHSVSIDLLLRALLSLGANRKRIAALIADRVKSRPAA